MSKTFENLIARDQEALDFFKDVLIDLGDCLDISITDLTWLTSYLLAEAHLLNGIEGYKLNESKHLGTTALPLPIMVDAVNKVYEDYGIKKTSVLEEQATPVIKLIK